MLRQTAFIQNDTIREASRVKSLSDVSVEEFTHGDHWKVWVLHDVWENLDLFDEVTQQCPIYESSPDLHGVNPFLKQAVIFDMLRPMENLLAEMNEKYLESEITPRAARPWANIMVVDPEKRFPFPCMFPHTDQLYTSRNNLVANIWLHEESEGQGTAFWRVRENDSAVDCPEFQALCSRALSHANKNFPFFNYESDEYLDKVLVTPAKRGTVTVYTGHQIHSPVCSTEPGRVRRSWVATLGEPF